MKDIPVVIMCVHLDGKVIPVITSRLLRDMNDTEITLAARKIVQQCRQRETDCDWSQPRVALLYFGLAKRPKRADMVAWDGPRKVEVTVLNLNPGENVELRMFQPYQEFLSAARNSLLAGKSVIQTTEELSISPLRIWQDGKITKELAYAEVEALAEGLKADGYLDA